MKGKKSLDRCSPQWIWRVHAMRWHGKFHCPRFEGCPHHSRVYCYRTTASLLKVTMVDQPRRLCPPAFSWNGGMVQHVLKSDPALRELEHIQVNSPVLAYLFFYNRHGHGGLTKEAALAICSHLADTFSEWIGRSAHFEVVPLLLEEGHWCMTAAQERCR